MISPRLDMKIIELKLFYKGWLSNQAAIQRAMDIRALVPYPNCTSPDTIISIMKVLINGELFTTEIVHDQYSLSHLKPEEVYQMLKSQIIAYVHAELDKQSNNLIR